MTVRDIITRFQALMDSMNVTFWDDTRSIALINTFKDKMAQEFGINRVEQEYTFYSVEGQETYQVPATFVSHELLYFNSSYNRKIEMVNGPGDIFGPASDVDVEGIPMICYIWGVSGRRELRVYPTFNEDGLTVRWWFYGWPPDVANDNDEPRLPQEWHPTIVEAMIDFQQAFDGQISQADRVMLWEMHIKRLKRLDATVEFMTKRGQQYGTIDDNFPRIADVSDLEFRAKFSGGAVVDV